MTWETVVGLEIHVQLKTRDEDVLPLRNGLRGPARTRRRAPSASASPDTPRHQPAGGRVDGQARPGSRLPDRAPCGLRAEELLLPRPVEGLSDLAVRYANLARNGKIASADAGGRASGRDGARAPRGGRGENGARGRGTPAASAAPTTRWSTTTAAARRCLGRDGTRHPLGRGGEALPPAPAPDRRRARHLGCRDGEGHAACRRQRLGVARRAPASSGPPCEIKNMNSFNYVARGDRGGGRAADRDLGIGRRGRGGRSTSTGLGRR